MTSHPPPVVYLSAVSLHVCIKQFVFTNVFDHEIKFF